MVVEIFKTNINNTEDAERVIQLMLLKFPTLRINFDLEDCDKILRVEGIDVSAELIQNVLFHFGYHIEILK